MRRVTTVDFHPVAGNVLITSSGDNTMRMWDIQKGSEVLKVEGHTDMFQSISWNWNGSVAATSCKDKQLRLIDPRTGQILSSTVAHDGPKGFKVTWMGNKDRLCTAGQGKTSDRQVSVWDTRKLTTPLNTLSVDNGSGLFTPYYDDTGVLFLAGKGDGNIKMFELEDADPYIHYLTEYSSTIPSQGVAFMHKTSCNIKEAEILKVIRLTTDYAETLSFTVPRTRLDLFQDDIFPMTRDKKAALSSDEWFKGQNKDPVMVNLQPSGMEKLSENQLEKKGPKYSAQDEIGFEDEGKIKEKVLGAYFQKVGKFKEGENQVLKQDKMEGAESSEWE